MEISHLLTPYKLNRPVIQASGKEGMFDRYAVDCPTPFRHNGKYYMMYIGFDGTGYQTAIATSDKLSEGWSEPKLILKRGANMDWDKIGMAGTTILMENDLFGGNHLKKFNGKYWLMYHSYPNAGYESGPAKIGLCCTDDEELLNWEFYGEPVYLPDDGGDWEKGGLYKCWLIEHEGTFYMFYNAKTEGDGWIEQIGAAKSNDMIHWSRFETNPIVKVDPRGWDSQFASDPQVYFDSRENQWVMFYYGLGNLSACDGIAVSKNLIDWEKFPIPIITTGRSGDAIDSIYAHKPGIIYCREEQRLYHFYCACRPYKEGDGAENFGHEFRCISAAVSK